MQFYSFRNDKTKILYKNNRKLKWENNKMRILLMIVIFISNFLIFFNMFDNLFINLLLTLQFGIILYWIASFLIYLLERKMEIRKIDEIDENDKEKFKYYRDILKNYSMGELGYLFNGKGKVRLLIAAEIEYLKMRKCIKVNENGIEIIDDTNCDKSEKYILEHYKFLNEKEFEYNYLKCIEESLEEKSCIKSYDLKEDPKIVFSFLVTFLSFFVGWYFVVTKANSVINSGIFVALEVIYFILFSIVSVFSMNTLGNLPHERNFIKTSIGKEISLKLYGLKNFINDFGNFDEKVMEEITLWEEYILYAIILNESNSLIDEAKKEFEELVEIIYKV